ncbi:MAG: PAS domain S-box protein [Elusimicrobiaceae bacterium]|nr:PAS domain S-box protein [Elusimicrobiaceae bacterium]
MTHRQPARTICDNEGRIGSAAPGFAAACGLNPAALNGTSLFDLVPTNWQSDAIKAFCRALTCKDNCNYVFPVKTVENQTAPARLSRRGRGAITLEFAEPGPGHIASRFFDACPDPCFVLDSRLRIRDANRAATLFYGIGKFDLQSRNFESLGGLPRQAFRPDETAGKCTVRHTNSEKEPRDLEITWNGVDNGFFASLHDNTGLRRENITLRENAERFRVMAEAAPGCFYMIAPNWSQVYFAGPLFETIFMRTRQELYSNPALLLTVIHPDDREKAMKAYSSQSGVAEYRIILPGGQSRTVRDFVIPVLDDDGEVKAYTGYIEAMEELDCNEKDYGQYHAGFDAKEQFLERSAQLAQILGYAGPQELMAVPPDRLYADPARRAELLRRLSANGYLREEQVEYRAKDGRLMWVSVSADHSRADGQDWLDTIVKDITAIKETELYIQRQQQPQQNLTPVFSELASGFAMADIVMDDRPRFKFTACNSAFERIAGVEEPRIVGRFADDVFRKKSVRRAIAVLQDAAVKNMPVNFNYTTTAGVHYRISVFFPAPGELAAVLTDITEMRRTQEELEQSHLKLRELTAKLQHAREEERRVISRELHDGLASRLTAVKLALGTARELAAETVKTGTDRALRIKLADVEKRIEEIMQETKRIAASLRPPVLDDLGFPEAVRLLVDDFRAVSGIGCRLRVDAVCRSMPAAHTTAAFRILQESLANIISHSKAERAKVGVTCHDGMLILAVEDNGRGIAEETLNSRKSLGILGMRERAVALGGELKIVTGQNKGTRICAHIPLGGNCPPDNP